MSLKTISEVAKEFHVSTRMLRYYDEMGLLPSIRADGSQYRLYDADALERLRRILLLRSLRIPLRQMAEILQEPDSERTAAVFRECIAKFDAEIAELKAISTVLKRLTERPDPLPEADGVAPITDHSPALPVCGGKINAERIDFMDACPMIHGLGGEAEQVRILYLPPCDAAAVRFVGESPEENAERLLCDFVENTRLHQKKPDLRVFGFNNPSPHGQEPYGYEFWVTIPESMEVPAPAERKRFPGGLYAAHCIRMGDFQEWGFLNRWVETNGVYERDPGRGPDGMGGCLEEHLNAFLRFENGAAGQFSQVDLLTPIREKK